MIRRRCVKHGHRWGSYGPIPFQYCLRLFCSGEQVSPWVPTGALRDALIKASNDGIRDKRR